MVVHCGLDYAGTAAGGTNPEGYDGLWWKGRIYTIDPQGNLVGKKWWFVSCFLYLVTFSGGAGVMVGHCGLEPQTPVLSGLCSNQLS
jgi:hypothetical protein